MRSNGTLHQVNYFVPYYSYIQWSVFNTYMACLNMESLWYRGKVVDYLSYCIKINTLGLVINSFEIWFVHMGPPLTAGITIITVKTSSMIWLILYIYSGTNNLITCDTDRILEFWLHILNLHENGPGSVWYAIFWCHSTIPFLIIITKDDQLGYCKGYEPDMKKPSSYMESPSNFTSDNI